MKYWAYINNEILGPYEKEKLFELPVFSASTLICPQTPVGEKTQDWKEASTYPEVAALLGGAAPAQASPAAAPIPAAAAAPAEQPKPGAGSAPAPLPKPDAVGPGSKIERPAPVFNTEMPESKLKPLSLHNIDQTPPAAAPHIEGADFSASRLGEAKSLPTGTVSAASTPDPLKSAPSFTSPSFNPMTLSQIGKRADAQIPEAARPAEAMITISQIDKRAGAQHPGAASPAAGGGQPPSAESAAASPQGQPVSPGIEALHSAAASFTGPVSAAHAAFTLAPVPVYEAPAPAPAPSPSPSPANVPQGAPADSKSFDEINSRLDALVRTALTKQDIEPLREKLGQMGEVLSSMKGSQFQREITDKLQHVENSIADIKASLSLMSSAAPAPAAQRPRVAEIESNSASMMALQPAKAAPAKPAEPAKPAAAPKQEIVDQGSSGGKAAKIIGVIKKISKLLITLVLLAAVLGGAAFALKQFNVFDVTKFLPFQIPYLSSPQAEPATPAPQPFQQSGEAQAVNQEAGQGGQAGTPQAEPPKKDLSPEIIYIGRTHAVKPGGDTLENMIYRDAAARKGDFNKTTWQVKELPGNIFELDGVIPLKDNSGQLIYRYEIDYAQKIVKPLDGMSKKPMDAQLKAGAAAQQNRSKSKKGRKGTAPAAARQSVPAAKVKAKAAIPADDEYEYVDEEETGGTEE